MYQDLSTRRDWPVKKPLSICQSGLGLLSPMGVGEGEAAGGQQNMDTQR